LADSPKILIKKNLYRKLENLKTYDNHMFLTINYDCHIL